MGIARTSAEAVVGDQIWLMPGTNDRGYPKPHQPVLAEVIKVARVYLTVRVGEGTGWAYGTDEYYRDDGGGRTIRGHQNYRRVMGYEQRKRHHTVGLIDEIRKWAEAHRFRSEISAGELREVEEVAHILGLPVAPDYSKPPADPE